MTEILGERDPSLTPREAARGPLIAFVASGSELLAVFGSNGFGEASQQLGSQAQLLARDAALFDDVSDKLALTGVKVRGFWIGLADKVAPVLKPLLDKFASLDLAKMGQDFGDIVAFIMQAFADGKMGDILWTSAKIALAKIANTVVGLFTALGQALITTLIEGVKTVLTLLSIATSADFWIGMGYSMLAAAKNFIAFVEEGFAKIFDGMRDWWFIGEGAGEAADGLKQDAADLRGFMQWRWSDFSLPERTNPKPLLKRTNPHTGKGGKVGWQKLFFKPCG